MRHHRVAAEDVLRSAFLGSPGHQEYGGPPVLELLRYLGMGEQFKVDDLVDVDLGAGGHRGQENKGYESHGLLHASSKDYGAGYCNAGQGS